MRAEGTLAFVCVEVMELEKKTSLEQTDKYKYIQLQSQFFLEANTDKYKYIQLQSIFYSKL